MAGRNSAGRWNTIAMRTVSTRSATMRIQNPALGSPASEAEITGGGAAWAKSGVTRDGGFAAGAAPAAGPSGAGAAVTATAPATAAVALAGAGAPEVKRAVRAVANPTKATRNQSARPRKGIM